MDKAAVSSATGEQLAELGLSEKGHIIALKAFCLQDCVESSKSNLICAIKESEKDRVSKSRKISTNIVSIGWQHFNRSKDKYCSIRETNGGGTRQHKFQIDATKEDVMNVMPSRENRCQPSMGYRAKLTNQQHNYQVSSKFVSTSKGHSVTRASRTLGS